MISTPVSVVVATCNGSLYIRSQLDSIVSQLASDDELIVVDDCSTDNTWSVLESYQSSNVRLISSGINCGPITTFEHGIRMASNDVVILSDQDDVWFPDRINLIKRFFSNPLNPPMLSLDSIIVDENLSIICPSSLSFIDAGDGIVRNIIKNRYIGCHLAFRRVILDIALPFPEGIPMHDVWLGLIAEFFYSSYFLKIPTMYFRRHGNNYTPLATSLLFKLSWRIRVLFLLARRALAVLW